MKRFTEKYAAELMEARAQLKSQLKKTLGRKFVSEAGSESVWIDCSRLNEQSRKKAQQSSKRLSRVKCHYCDGRGSHLELGPAHPLSGHREHKITCEVCKGAGRLNESAKPIGGKRPTQSKSAAIKMSLQDVHRNKLVSDNNKKIINQAKNIVLKNRGDEELQSHWKNAVKDYGQLDAAHSLLNDIHFDHRDSNGALIKDAWDSSDRCW